ncbi:hypothetical protein BDV23DRAFT_149397 [Aspergillus alliaceus]|uniref:Uncharacterized protein n=1 Tax=Petromyces alliaceus TaxID=209559 RepID=A0A5N7CHA1_PETAA|nr:hypothetical protein BDV23DRAFT_149397 [Aspergillus alliaceus]
MPSSIALCNVVSCIPLHSFSSKRASTGYSSFTHAGIYSRYGILLLLCCHVLYGGYLNP